MLCSVPINNWEVDYAEKTKLFVGCKGIKPTEKIKLRLKEVFKVDNLEDIEIFHYYAIIDYKDVDKCEAVCLKAEGAIFNSREVLLSRSLHQLSRGRLEIIQNYKLTSVVLECKGITDGCKADIIELAKKHGLVKKLDVLQGKATIEFSHHNSVISFLAVENEGTFCLYDKVAKLNEDTLKDLNVEEKYLALIHDIHDVVVYKLKDLHDKEESEIVKTIGAIVSDLFRNVRNIVYFKNNHYAHVTFYDSETAFKALAKQKIKRQNKLFWNIGILGQKLRNIKRLQKQIPRSASASIITDSRLKNIQPVAKPTPRSLSANIPDLSSAASNTIVNPPSAETRQLNYPSAVSGQLSHSSTVSGQLSYPSTVSGTGQLSYPSAETGQLIHPFAAGISSNLSSMTSGYPISNIPPSYPGMPPGVPFSTSVPFSINIPPPSILNNPQLGAAAVKEQSNDIEIICTMSCCLAYCKTICTTLRCLDLKVGVLNPPQNSSIDSIVDSIKTSGVTAIVFIDKTNAKEETLSAKFVNNSNIKLKDIPLNMAVQEFARAFGRSTDIDVEREKTRARIHQEASTLFSKGRKHPPPSSGVDRHIQGLLSKISREEPVTLNENDQLIKYLVERRMEKISKEYKDYIPHSLRNAPAGPFGDRELKVERETIEDAVRDILQRNITEDEVSRSVAESEVDKDKISSAISTLLSTLSSDGLKQITSLPELEELKNIGGINELINNQQPSEKTSTPSTVSDTDDKRKSASSFWN